MSYEQSLKYLRFTAAILGALFTITALGDFSRQFYIGTAIGLLAGFIQVMVVVRAHTALKELRNGKP